MVVAANNLWELLPFYVNGTLDAEATTEVERAISQDAHMRQEAEVLRRIRLEMRDTDIGYSPGEFGLARLMRQIEKQQPVQKIERPSIAGVAASVAAVVALTALVATLGGKAQENEGYVQASGEDISASLTVTFQPLATEAAISALLLDKGLIITDGPSALGLYRLVPSDNADLVALAEVLRDAEDVVQSVEMPE